MKIKEILSQHRRDFKATLVCEHCSHEQTLFDGYDDNFYHTKVIPNLKCDSCGEKSPDDYAPMSPKYSEWEIV